MRTILVVLLYGYLDKSRPEVELRGYREYLLSAAGKVALLFGSGKLVRVILSGGLTVPSMHRSEAEDVCSEFRNALKMFWYSLAIDLEKTSKNTTQNIAHAIKQAQADGLQGQFVFVCDRVRWFRVWALARRICKEKNASFGGVIGIPRPDTHPHSRWWRQFALALRYLFCPYSVIEAEINP